MNIVTIKNIKRIDTPSKLYDLETANNHNFFGNGILVHNSHLSFVVDANTLEVRPAKRSSLTDGSFYNCQEVVERYTDAAKSIADELVINTLSVNIDTIQIEGELYGEGIQKRVNYGPKNFCAYDIQVIGTMDGEETSYYLAPRMVVKLCEKHSIPHAPVFEDAVSFEEAMDINPVFDSLVTSMRIPGNTAEGVVLKPSKPLYLGNGSRVIIKNKNEAFAEKMKRKKAPKPEVEWSDEMTRVYATMEEFNTENRIRSAISKMGALSQKDFGKLLRAVQHDLLDDWKKEYSFGTLEKSEQKVLTKRLNKDVGALIRTNFLNIIDGVF